MINWQLAEQGIRWPVSPDRIAGSGVDPSRSSMYLFEVIRWQVSSFQMIAGSSSIFLIHMKYVVFYMCRTIKILISNWPRKLKFSQFLQACQLLSDFSHQGHALVALYVQFLCSAWSKFDRWGHAKNLCSILKLVYFDSRSWQSFVSICDVFHGLFPLNVQNEICYQESSVIHG